MPALNRTYLIESAGDIVCLFSNSDNVADVVNASLTPVGTTTINDNAKYYEYVLKTYTYMIFVPQGYTLGDTYTYNTTYDVWSKRVVPKVPYSARESFGLHYYTDEDFDEPLIAGYTGYVFAEYNKLHEPVGRTYPISFTIVKNNN